MSIEVKVPPAPPEEDEDVIITMSRKDAEGLRRLVRNLVAAREDSHGNLARRLNEALYKQDIRLAEGKLT